MWANVWPSTDTVSGLSGELSGITVTLYDWSASYDPSQLSYLLQAPNGTAFELLQTYNCQEFGDAVTDSASTITVSDAGSTHLPDSTGNPGSCTSLSGNTYKPTEVVTGDVFPSTVANAGTANATGSGLIPYTNSSPAGSGTLNATFANLTGTHLNGTWNLYVEDYQGGVNDCDAGHCESSSLGSNTDSPWSINITTTGASNDNTTTTLSSNNNPSFTTAAGNSVTLTAAVTDTTNNATTVTAGTVNFTSDGTTISGCGSQSVNSSGQATCTTTGLTEGSHSIQVTYNGAGMWNSSSSGTVTQTVFHHTTIPSAGQYCNDGGVTIPAPGSSGVGPFGANAYPSEVFVGPDGQNGVPTNGGTAGLGGNISNVTVQLNAMSFSSSELLGLMLVGPNGSNYDLMSYAGGGNVVTSANVTLADGSTQLPANTAPSSGTYSPASYNTAEPDTWASPAPSTFNSAAPRGTATFESEFGGAGADGAWKLFAEARGGGISGTLGSWCLTFSMNSGDSTSTSVSSSGSPSTTGSSVTFTATVTDSTHPATTVNGGTVDFTSDGATISGCAAVSVSNGQAQCTTSALSEGIHVIGAQYGGSSAFGDSQGTSSQEVDNATTESINGNVYTYCNPNTGGINIPNSNQVQGAGYPYPSNVNVTNLPGTIDKTTININGFTTNAPDLLRSLVVGPSQTATDSLDFFSNLSSTTSVANQNLTFDDAAASGLTTPTGGTYKPTSANGTSDAFGTPAPSGTYNYAQPAGTATLGSVFGSGSGDTSTGNGKWSFYFFENGVNGGGTSITGHVCLNFTENPPVLTLTKSHIGSFTQGQSGQYTVTVGNNGPGPTGGTVTVTDNAPTGMTVTAMSGTGWTCTTLPTCTRTNALASGNTYPSITVTVDVAATAPAGTDALTNSVTVSGGGAANVTQTDQTTIVATTGTAVTSSANPSTYGQSITFTATVQEPNGSGTPTGSVQFYTDGTALTGTALGSSVNLNNSGQATSIGIATLSVSGSAHTITAVYSGDTLNSGSTGTLTGGQTVNALSESATAGSPTIAHGAAIPVISASYSPGLIAPDTSISGISCGTTAVAGSPPGTYPTTCSGTSTNSNYTVSGFTPGTLTITPSDIPGSGPGIVDITPNSVTVNSGQLALTINGRDFDNSAQAQVNGAPVTTTFVSSSQITATVPASALAYATVLDVYVVDGTTTNQVGLYVTPAATTLADWDSRTDSNPVVVLGAGGNNISAQVTGGSGTIQLASYSTNPVGNGTTGSDWFDVHLAPPAAAVTQVTIVDCDTGGGTVGWFNPANGKFFVPVQTVDGNGCADIVVTAMTTPSVLDLNGSIFGTNTSPTAVWATGFSHRLHGDYVTFRWRAANHSGIAGFGVFARRADGTWLTLNRKLILVHRSRRYAVTIRYDGRGPFQLRALLAVGRWVFA